MLKPERDVAGDAHWPDDVQLTHAGGIHGLVDEGEDIRVHVVPFDQALAGIASGTIDSATAIIALQWLALNRARLRASGDLV